MLKSPLTGVYMHAALIQPIHHRAPCVLVLKRSLSSPGVITSGVNVSARIHATVREKPFATEKLKSTGPTMISAASTIPILPST
jgi:hypothetical protein